MVTIESVTVNDAEELLSIYSYYVEKTAVSFEYEVPSKEEFENRIKNISSKYPYIKAVDENGRIVGYAYAGVFKGRKAYDHSVETTIYLDEAVRRKGYGTIIYDELENRLKKMGILNLYACIASTETEDEYLTNASKLFHGKKGYSLVGTFHKCGNKFNRWYDMVWMEKFIGEHTAEEKPVLFGSDI